MTDESEPDYLARHNATFRRLGAATILNAYDRHAFFERQTPESIAPILNRAIGFGRRWLSRNLDLSPAPTEVPEEQIEQIALRIALRFLPMFCSWRHGSEPHKDQPLELTANEMQHPYSREEVLFFCEHHFAPVYQSVAAELLGMSLAEFQEWESNARVVWNWR
jgi:hypothetical protein